MNIRGKSGGFASALVIGMHLAVAVATTACDDKSAKPGGSAPAASTTPSATVSPAAPIASASAPPAASSASAPAAVPDAVAAQQTEIATAADWFAGTILAGRMVHVFGSGHSRIMVEEMWPRYGSFPGFNPIVELSLTFHNLVVGANGQRQAMFLENTSGLAERILRNFDVPAADSALVISSGGGSVVSIEMTMPGKSGSSAWSAG